jgi:hypothetical protein
MRTFNRATNRTPSTMIQAFIPRALGSISVILTLATCASAQQLANTTWTVTNQGNPMGFMHFDGSVLSFSLDDVSYDDISNYTDNSGNFTLVDILACPGILGTYTYSIADDTLHWTLVSDTCYTRPEFFVNYDWVSHATGIGEAVGAVSVVVFPNPAADVIHIRSLQTLSQQPYMLCDGLGKVVSTGRLQDREDVIDVAHLAPGTYILQVGNGALAPLRIVKL